MKLKTEYKKKHFGAFQEQKGLHKHMQDLLHHTVVINASFLLTYVTGVCGSDNAPSVQH